MLSLWHKPDTAPVPSPTGQHQTFLWRRCHGYVTDMLSGKSASNPQKLCFTSHPFTAQHVATMCIDLCIV